MPESTKAVFLSYASQDVATALRISTALRAAGVEVWLDQEGGLVGGDAWDRKIREQIGSCALFVPLISANTQARKEGYFRLEWHLAEERVRLIAKGAPFIVPVSVDGTTKRGALVPDAFLAVQWTRIARSTSSGPAGSADSLPVFCERVNKLLGREVAGATSLAATRPIDQAQDKLIPAAPSGPPARSDVTVQSIEPSGVARFPREGAFETLVPLRGLWRRALPVLSAVTLTALVAGLVAWRRWPTPAPVKNTNGFHQENMKLIIRMLVFGLIGMVSSLCFGQEAKTQRVLFLGNSVFNFKGGVHQTFEQFCKKAALNVEAFSQYQKPEHAHGVEFLNYGRIPLNLPEMAADPKIHSLIRSGNFDQVILEGRRTGYLLPDWVELPTEANRGKHIPYEQNLAAIGKLHRAIVESGARTVLYLHPGTSTQLEIDLPVAQIYQRLHADLQQMEIKGKRHIVTLVPAGFLWQDAARRFGHKIWYANPTHGNQLARYASACMLYTYLTGKDPRENDFRELSRDWTTPPTEPAQFASVEDAQWIKRQVWLYYSTRPE